MSNYFFCKKNYTFFAEVSFVFYYLCIEMVKYD